MGFTCGRVYVLALDLLEALLGNGGVPRVPLLGALVVHLEVAVRLGVGHLCVAGIVRVDSRWRIALLPLATLEPSR